MNETRKEQVERRNLLSSFFITLLIGVAYQDMIAAVRESLGSGLSYGTSLLALTFFFTSMRFFVGNQLHLLSQALVEMPGVVWLYDLMVIIAQSVALIFLGGFSAVPVNRNVEIGFVELLVVLYVIDIAWILSQWGFGEWIPSWRRQFIPWAWAILNTVLVLAMLLVSRLFDDIYSSHALSWLFFLNLVGFVVDVVLVDQYSLFFKRLTEE